MMEKAQLIEKINRPAAPGSFYIKITALGPYLVYGNPPLDQEIILLNEEKKTWVYRLGMRFDNNPEPMALCRCGISKRKPFCDGSHSCADWDPKETAAKKTEQEDLRLYEGPLLVMADYEKYCAFARFCDACGNVWNLVQYADTIQEKEIAIHEAKHCPSGRLILLDKALETAYEPDFEPSLSILEDPGIKVSGPIWVKGGIRIESADGTSYEIRNRVTLCRCGRSTNKPFCDGTHAAVRFCDDLPIPNRGKMW